MGSIDSVRWLRASGYLDRALDTPAHEREAYLAALRAEDPVAADDIAALLEAHRRLAAEGFLERRPAFGIERWLSGMRIGAYTLEWRLGHGRTGTVWLASRSDSPGEGEVALKLFAARRMGRAAEERFTDEATRLSRLTHPSIARLIDAGLTPGGQTYLVHEHVEGRHIDTYCDEEQRSLDARLRLFLAVQAAVAHAHAGDIVHGHLRPSNVLATATGQVKLLDVGVAQLIDPDDAMTPASDVYALGLLLHHLVGRQHRTPMHGGLEMILARAVKKSPADPYPTVTAFADDLRRYLDNQPMATDPLALNGGC